MIIKSLLDLDFYKLTMGQLFFEKFPNSVIVEYKFKNRSKYSISCIDIDLLNEELANLSKLRLNTDEISYLKRMEIFSAAYIGFLSNIKLGTVVATKTETGEPEIVYHGDVRTYIYFETYILSIINGLYYKSKYKTSNEVIENGLSLVEDKFKSLSHLPPKSITEFGTRRRFSSEYQDMMVSVIKKFPQFAGTSNVYLAMKYKVNPIGTNAHEMYMINAGMNSETDESLRLSQIDTLDMWESMYDYNLRIALSDTFGTASFIEDFTPFAKNWLGVRHDSGDPIKFGYMIIDMYKKCQIDPRDKLLVFSDGLDADIIDTLYKEFEGKIKMSFGWGTKLSNALGYETLSIVVKPSRIISISGVQVNINLVKLSDNLNKNTGDTDTVNQYKRVFGYKNTESAYLEV